MEFHHQDLQTRLSVPDEPSFRQILSYDSHRDGWQGEEIYVRLWEAAKQVIIEWDCPHIKLDVSLDDVAGNPEALKAIKWASLAVFTWRQELDEVEKK